VLLIDIFIIPVSQFSIGIVLGGAAKISKPREVAGDVIIYELVLQVFPFPTPHLCAV
jgi:hypothetical protein